MQLIVSRVPNFHEGLIISLKDGNDIKNIGRVNGNKADFGGPILLFGIDQDVVYGLSHREVTSRIYSQGPQILMTTKELGHRLYEHGMKASLGKIKIGNTHYLTSLETYYTVMNQYGPFKMVVSGGRLGCWVQPYSNYLPILLTTGAFETTEKVACRIDIDKIQTEVTKKFLLDDKL